MPGAVTLSMWSEQDEPLLALANAPAMTRHLNGPEPADALHERHRRYLRLQDQGTARMFRIDCDGAPAGSIGWWGSEWSGAPVHEAGWFVLPQAQGRGVAAEALRLLLVDVAEHAVHERLAAFPAVGNVASNALCRRSGFLLEGQLEEEFRGAPLRMNAWLRSARRPAVAAADPRRVVDRR